MVGYDFNGLALTLKSKDANNTFKIISKYDYPFHMGSTGGTIVYEATATLGGSNFYIVKDEWPSEFIKNAIELDGVYNVDAFVVESQNLSNNLYLPTLNVDIKKQAIKSILKNDSIISLGAFSLFNSDGSKKTFNGSGYSNLRFVSLNNKYAPNSDIYYDLDLGIFEKTKMFHVQSKNITTALVFETESLKNLPNLKAIQVARFHGDLSKISPSIVFLNSLSTGLVSGSLEGYVDSMKSKGKTNGFLAFTASNATTHLTYNGESLAYNIEHNLIPNILLGQTQNGYCIRWEANTGPIFVNNPDLVPQDVKKWVSVTPYGFLANHLYED